MEVRQGYSYHNKNEFFDLAKDKYLLSNKEDGNYRPYFLAIQDNENKKLYHNILTGRDFT